MAETQEATKPAVRFTLAGLGSKWDGDYEFADLSFTNRELHTIKRLSGVRAGEIGDALSAGDQDLAVAFAFIALERNNTPIPENRLWDADSDFMTVHDDETADDDEESEGTPDPLGSTPDGTPESSEPSGTTSEPSSAPSPSDQSPTGDPGSDPNSTSPQE